MALNHGKDGGVYDVTNIAGAVVTVDRIAETTSWSINALREFAEIRKHGAEWVKRLGGIRDWNGSVDAITDPSTNQTLMTERLIGGAASKGTMVVALYHSDNSAGGAATTPRWEGTCFISNITDTSPAADLQTVTIDFVGHGTLQYIGG